MPDDEDICDITREVFASLGYDTTPVEQKEVVGGLTSYVHIDGASATTVYVQLPFELAGRLAANMFDVPLTAAPGEEMRDIAGEIANMIGGNLKSIMPGPSRLSIPIIEEGRSPRDLLAHRRQAETSITFACELGHFVVKVTSNG